LLTKFKYGTKIISMAIVKKKKSQIDALVSKSFEFVSSEIFDLHPEAITDLIGKSSGIYALYFNDHLYYVGKATHLKSRIKQHLRDRHKRKWNYFSLYLINHSDHINEFESLLIRIVKPKGNKVNPKGKDLKSTRLLVNAIKERQRLQLEKLVKPKRKRRTDVAKRVKLIKSIGSSEGLVSKRTRIYRTYKGRNYVAVLYPNGKVRLESKTYPSPTAAALKITKGIRVNGKYFWRIKNKNGELSKLRDL
jgi:hypothetical protein